MSQALLVEDDPGLLELYSYALEPAGCTVHKAEDLTTALTLLTQHKMDVIVTDYRYPGQRTEDKGGLELVKHVIDKSFPPERIIMMSADPNLKDILRQEGIISVECLEKPFLLPLLANKVRKILAEPYRPDFPANGCPADNDNLNPLPKVV